MLLAGEDLVLVVLAGVAELEAEQEAVELGLWEGERALELDRILGGDDEERAGQEGGLALDGELAFLHRLEESGLRAGGGAVDLVGEDDLGDERPLAEGEVLGLLVEVVDARDVGGHEVGGELDSLEGAAEGAGDGLGEGRLAGAGDVLEKDMALAQEGDQRQLDDLALAHDDALDARAEVGSNPVDGVDVLCGETSGGIGHGGPLEGGIVGRGQDQR